MVNRISPLVFPNTCKRETPKKESEKKILGKIKDGPELANCEHSAFVHLCNVDRVTFLSMPLEPSLKAEIREDGKTD